MCLTPLTLITQQEQHHISRVKSQIRSRNLYEAKGSEGISQALEGQKNFLRVPLGGRVLFPQPDSPSIPGATSIVPSNANPEQGIHLLLPLHTCAVKFIILQHAALSP